VQTLSHGSKDAGYLRQNRREPGPTENASDDLHPPQAPVFTGPDSSDRRTASSSTMRMDSTAEAGPATALTLLEAALEAWADCQPDGYTLPEISVPLVLPAVACKVPGSWQLPGTSKMLEELFTPGVVEGGSGKRKPSVFERMLKAHNGQVHFLHFWSAFSKAARLLASFGGEAGDLLMVGGDEGLTLELETLRDGILRSLEAASATPSSPSRSRGPPERSMSTAQLLEAVHSAAAMSSSPAFWQMAEQALAENDSTSRLHMEELTVVILSWLRDAIAWQNERPAETQSPVLDIVDAAAADAVPTRQVPSGEIPVFLHIYDVSQEDGVHKLNGWLAAKHSPIKFGGVFHAGVEVNGLEWSYGMSLCESMPGISCVEPRTHPAHRYRQTVQLRNTKCSAEEIAELLSQVIEDYPGDDYDLLRRNCCHFADDFCRRLGAGRIPGWVHRLARVGAFADFALQAVTGRKLLNLEEEEDS